MVPSLWEEQYSALSYRTRNPHQVLIEEHIQKQEPDGCILPSSLCVVISEAGLKLGQKMAGYIYKFIFQVSANWTRFKKDFL